MGWGQIILLGLKLLNALVQWRQEASLLSAGEDREIAQQTLALTQRLKTYREVEAEYAAKTADEIKKAIEANGDFRD